MTRGKVWNLNRKEVLNNDVRVELWEIDRELFGKDDKLGPHLIIKRGHKAGEFEHAFSAFTGWSTPPAYYYLRFRIDR